MTTADGTHPLLASPLELNGRTMRNRIVAAPMSVCYGDADGDVTDRMVEHYRRRAAGGAGMVITENLAVSPSGRQLPRQAMIDHARRLPGLAALAEGIRREGALAVVQIVHAGRYAGPWEHYESQRRLAPSAVEFELLPGRRVTPQAMTRGEIDEVVEAFARATRLAAEAGFDGVELHGAQGMLLSSFQSPRMNLRDDEYGADRDRFARRVVEAVCDAAAGELLVGYHLFSDELVDGGLTPAHAVAFARQLDGAGVDFLIPIPTTFESLRLRRAQVPGTDPTDYVPAVAAELAEAVRIPVFANGGLGDPDAAEAVLRAGDAVAVALARPLLADPDWPRKALAGEAPRRCDCSPATCLHTQIQGAVCHSWPTAIREQGYWGMDDQGHEHRTRTEHEYH